MKIAFSVFTLLCFLTALSRADCPNTSLQFQGVATLKYAPATNWWQLIPNVAYAYTVNYRGHFPDGTIDADTIVCAFIVSAKDSSAQSFHWTTFYASQYTDIVKPTGDGFIVKSFGSLRDQMTGHLEPELHRPSDWAIYSEPLVLPPHVWATQISSFYRNSTDGFDSLVRAHYTVHNPSRLMLTRYDYLPLQQVTRESLYVDYSLGDDQYIFYDSLSGAWYPPLPPEVLRPNTMIMPDTGVFGRYDLSSFSNRFAFDDFRIYGGDRHQIETAISLDQTSGILQFSREQMAQNPDMLELLQNAVVVERIYLGKYSFTSDAIPSFLNGGRQ